MLKVPMNADIKEYSPKIVYGLDKRQLICTALALSYGIPFIRTASFLELSDRIAVAVILMLPVIACGWIKLYGMPFERFMLHIIVHHVLTPRTRMYRTEISIASEELPEKNVNKDRKKKKQHKKEVRKYGGIG